jgi:pimeloyl-ACP methyl ester carboxylesterase
MKKPIRRVVAALSLALAASLSSAAVSSAASVQTQTRYLTETVGEVEVFYREAGKQDAPAVLLLHGFPSSSHQFRELMPLLADEYRVIAPDFPGFGNTVAPPRGEFDYTFDNLASTIEEFTEALELEQYAMYVFDYGAPVGFRLALSHPERVTGVITQNGNAYLDGVSPAFDTIAAYWNEDTKENRDALRAFLTKDTTAWQYMTGVPDDRIHLISPDSIAHDQANIDKDHEIQLDLFKSYESNVKAYPKWQAYLREHQPPLLALWGKNDPFFIPAGAEAFKRDVPDAKVEFLDAGHWPLETHLHEMSARIKRFLRTL